MRRSDDMKGKNDEMKVRKHNGDGRFVSVFVGQCEIFMLEETRNFKKIHFCFVSFLGYVAKEVKVWTILALDSRGIDFFTCRSGVDNKR